MHKFVRICLLMNCLLFLALAKCPAQNTRVPIKLEWSEAAANSVMTVKCPGDTRTPAAFVRRKCLENGEWDDSIDLSPCPSPQLLQLIEKVALKASMSCFLNGNVSWFS